MSTSLPTLDMFEQLSLERCALRLLASPQIQREKKVIEDLYRSNWLGGTPDGRTRLDAGANALAVFAAQFAAMDDGARPKFMWNFAAPHAWHGLVFPGSG